MKAAPKEITFSIVLIAGGVVLSPFSFIAGPTKCYPFQHMVNAIAGVFLGPWYACFIALVIGIIRNAIGTGTIFAFPGGIPGALVVGLVYRYIKRNDSAVLTEPIGTTLGALISAFIVAPFIGKTMPPIWGIEVAWAVFTIMFLISSIPGALLGYAVIKMLRRIGVAEIIFPRAAAEKKSAHRR